MKNNKIIRGTLCSMAVLFALECGSITAAASEMTSQQTTENQMSESQIDISETQSTESQSETAEEQNAVDATGTAKLQWYGKTVDAVTVTIGADNTGRTDAWKEIQDVLNEAKDNATDANPYLITLPAGSYNISESLHIYSNTYLSMEGATINRCFTQGCMLRNGRVNETASGYNGSRNIYIKGGTWNGNAYNQTYGYTKSSHFSNLRFGHATNVTLDGVSITNNVSAHHVEFGGVDGVTVKNCTFKDQLNYKESDTGEYNGNEALQIDVIHSAYVFDDYQNYDDTISKNVTVTGCRFENVFRGVGSHTGVLGKYYENITITGNTFTNIEQQAVIATNYKHCKISDNTMTKVGAGIEFKYMTQEGTSYYKPVSGSITNDPDCDTVISGNRITTQKTDNFTDPEGIRIMGWNLTSKKKEVPAGDYYIKGMEVSSNTVNANGYGIRFIDVRDSKLTGNTVNVGKDSNGASVASSGIYISASQGVEATGNTIVNPSENGIMVNSTSKNNVLSENSIQNANGFGIQVYSKSTGNTIRGNRIVNTKGCGIQISTSSSATITGNTITGSAKEGIKIYKDSSATIRDQNVIKGSGSNGIAISNASSKVTVTGNTVESSGKSGVSVYEGCTKEIRVTENTLTKNREHGVLVNKKSAATITNNTIKNSTKNGICVTSGSGTTTIMGNKITDCKAHGIGMTASTVKINSNTITGNTKYGISLSSKGTVKEMKSNTLSNKGIREIYVASNVKSIVKSLDAVSIKNVKASAKKVTGKATGKTTITVKAGKTKLGTVKLKSRPQYSVKIKKQKKGTNLRVESTDKMKNVAYRTIKVK